MRRLAVLAWPLIAGALLLAGCHVSPAYKGTRVACTSDADCSGLGTGYTCQPAGFCAGPGAGDGGTVSDGGTAGDGGVGDGGASCTPQCRPGESCTTSGCVPTAPLAVTITTPTAGAVVGDGPEVHATVTGAVGRVRQVVCSVAGNGVQATKGQGDWVCTPDLSGVAEGAKVTIRVTATDAAPRSKTAKVSVVHDGQAPTVTITHPQTDGVYVQKPGPFAVAAKAGDAHLADLKLAYLDPAGTAHPVKDCTESPTSGTCAGTVSLTAASAHGTYTLLATATDAAGNVTTSKRTFKITDTGPAVAYTQTPPNPVRRDTDASIAVTVTDADAQVGATTVVLKGAGAGGADLNVPATAANTQGTTVFTVTGRSGTTATPVLDAAQKSWPLVATATDVWGNASTKQGTLTVTRVAWHTDLSGGASGTVALSPAVAANGKVYVVSRPANGADTLYVLDGATGAKTKVGSPIGPVVRGPVLQEGPSGIQALYLLELRSASANSNVVEAIAPDGTSLWTYPSAKIIGTNASAEGLPAIGSLGEVYVPIFAPSAITSNEACVDQVNAQKGTRDNYACVTQSSKERVSVAVYRQSGQDTVVAFHHPGEVRVVDCSSSSCVVGGSATPVPQAVGGPMLTPNRFYLVGVSRNATTGKAVGFNWGNSLGSAGPDWQVTLVGPTTGAVHDAGVIGGGLTGNAWYASAKDPNTFATVALPVNGSVSSVSLGTTGTAGRAYDLVDTGSGAYVVAFGPPSAKPLWRYPDPGASTTLPSPQAGTSAVLGPAGYLIVPDGAGGVTSLITDSLHPAPGWADTRGDAARTAAIGP